MDQPKTYNISNLVLTITGVEVDELLDAQLVQLANEYLGTTDQLLFDGVVAMRIASAFIDCDRDIDATRAMLLEGDTCDD